MKFPNKMIEAAYDAAKGKTFTRSSVNGYFKDQNGNSDYDYHATLWLLDNSYLVQHPYDPRKSFVHQYSLKPS